MNGSKEQDSGGRGGGLSREVIDRFLKQEKQWGYFDVAARSDESFG